MANEICMYVIFKKEYSTLENFKFRIENFKFK